jgi:hypothetical protein
MTVHILKLCVGCDSVEDLRSYQARRLADFKARGEAPTLMHVTRMTPRRDGFAPGVSSLYWVIGGYIRARQPIVAVREVESADGIKRCGLVLSPELKATEPSPRRPFQGWRYIDAADVPADLSASAEQAHNAIPPKMRAELEELRLI